MLFEIDNKQYEVIIEKKNNKNTYIRVKDDLKIYVTTSYFVSNSYISKLLNENREYIRKIILKKEKMQNDTSYNYLGKSYQIILCNMFDEIEFDNDKIFTPNIKTLEKFIKNKIKTLFEERLDHNYNLFTDKVVYPKLKIRNMKTRWGVCNLKDNSITLNSKLIEYDVEALDYVIIHELCHFVHFNHSKDFWKLVEKNKSNYKAIRKYLRD